MTPPPLTLRPATEHDISLLLCLIKELADYEHLAHEVLATEDLLRQTLFGPRRFVEALLAHHHGQPAGFAVFFHNVSTFLGRPGLYLEDLYVRPHLRNQGIGKALLTRLARLAQDRHCGRLEWAVLNWNTPALHFYQSLGATPNSQWTTYRLTHPALSHLAAQDKDS
jgi:GNAT superfamily N-acetyltransferase